jgi:hypothetical protein
MNKWDEFNRQIQYCIDDINSMVHALDIKSYCTDERKLFLIWEIMHNLMNKFLATIVTSDIDNKIEAKRHFLGCVIQSCQRAIEYRLQEGIDENSPKI